MLESAKLKYVAMEKDDMELFAKWERTPDVLKYFFCNPYMLPEVERDTEAYDEHASELTGDKIAIYKVLLKAGVESADCPEKPIGLCGWEREGDIPGKYEIFLYIGESDLLSKGLGTEMVKTLVALLFESLAAHTVMLCYYAFNERGKRVYLDKCGFKYDGKRRNMVHFEGVSYDMEYASITRDEYAALKQGGIYGNA